MTLSSSPNRADVNALLGKGSEFEGKLTFEGTVRIDGRFSGEIYSDDTLVVGEGARVQAEINVSTVIIYGEVVGNINARNTVELHAPASLRGNIVAPSLHIDKGVMFDGMCQMTTGAAERTPTRATIPPPPAGAMPPPLTQQYPQQYADRAEPSLKF